MIKIIFKYYSKMNISYNFST